ncbi:class I SAM-dependent DNA methyltransferase [Acidisoma sp.]|uniref:class I SAM-dependent DNA methyltransferase n=1 Tax=Acidisoma sp. TaxID=1872115 RepID=UPI003AFFAB40
MSDRSRDAAYFEAMYAADPDPWQFKTSAYEAAKYEATVAAIADRRYRSALEVGCSLGVLSQRVAPLCDAFLGLDIAEAPLVEARQRCRDLPHVRFERKAIPDMWPEEGFDLILLSEVLYFLSPEDITATAAHVRRSLRPEGTVLLVNWIGNSEPPQPGDQAADAFLKAAGLPVARRERAELYRLELLRGS